MWWLKACPKCGGDLAEDWERNRHYVKCFQCGRELTTVEENRLRWQRRRTTSSSGLRSAQEDMAA